ncbi:MAG: hypothetical protein M1814_002160 [Vezdaea aestivalis]|nr:MAG: hypothetical protein M1814_002160 [Vezdaea aestivalis]
MDKHANTPKMTDEELDRDWKPSRRPQSTMARSFSAALHNMFDLDDSLGGLSLSIEQKKQAVSSQNRELEALEARLKRTEELLKKKQGSAGPASGSSSPHRRMPIQGAFDAAPDKQLEESSRSPKPVSGSTSRPSTARNPSEPSQPPLPISKEALMSESDTSPSSEYVLIDRVENTQAVERPKSSARHKKAALGGTSKRPAVPQ